jgi:phosphoglycerate dehydrogenase-like enzyme
MPALLPARDKLSICFAHGAYQMGDRFNPRAPDIAYVEARSGEDFEANLRHADVIAVSMMWRNEMIDRAPRLKFIQSISAGIEQYDTELLRARGVRLASAAGVNARAVAEHAMALMLALSRQLHTARDNQQRKHWRPMVTERTAREDQLTGKTLLIIGMGRIGCGLARLAKAFEMRVLATRRNVGEGSSPADEVHRADRLGELLPRADIVAVACPLTPSTENLINAQALALMKPTAFLINVARGRVVEEAALIAALGEGRIAAAGLDVTREEPLPAGSPLWSMPNVLITPHTAGETQRYEDGVIDLLLENLNRLWRGETALLNQIV